MSPGGGGDLVLRVLTWNILRDNASAGPAGWGARRASVVGLIDLLDPDIVMIQEALPRQAADLAAGLPELTWTGAPRSPGDESCPLGFRTSLFERVESGTYYLAPASPAVVPSEAPTAAWDARFPRVVTWVHLAAGSGRDRDGRIPSELFAASIHFDHEGARARRESAALVVDTTLRRAREHGHPLILGGDLNTAPGTPPYGRLVEAGLVDTASRAARRVGPLSTFPAGALDEAGQGVEGTRIDYVFVAGDLEVLRHACITHRDGLEYPSDHYPVLADLRPIDRGP